MPSEIPPWPEALCQSLRDPVKGMPGIRDQPYRGSMGLYNYAYRMWHMAPCIHAAQCSAAALTMHCMTRFTVC